MGWQRPVIQSMTTSHLDTCDAGEEMDCPDCVIAGIIQSEDCDTCGGCRWVHYCDGRFYSPVTQ